MTKLADVINSVPRSDLCRSTLLRGESRGDYQQLKAKAADPVAFDAERLVENGWTADKERAFQYSARSCNVYIADAEALIAALELAAPAKVRRDAEIEQKRRKNAELVAASNPKQKQEAPPVFDEDDIHFGTTT